MFSIEKFEQLIKSNMSAEDIYQEMKNLNPIYSKEKYITDEDEPFGIYVGGIGSDDFVTVNNTLFPLRMKFDSESIYIDFINELRGKIANNDKSFYEIVLSTVRSFSRAWFKKSDTPQSEENKLSAEKYMKAFSSSAGQRNNYARDHAVEIDSQLIYGISSFMGTGELAKCVEVNSVACNLLNFAGIESVLISGNFVNYKGHKEAHTFPLYKTQRNTYSLLDCMLKKQKQDILSGDWDFANGFDIQYPVTLKYSDGHTEQGQIKYSVGNHKKVINKGKSL